jgi:hypothetical protein
MSATTVVDKSINEAGGVRYLTNKRPPARGRDLSGVTENLGV